MTTILRIDTSARHANSITRKLTDRMIGALNADTVITRDLTTSLPQIDETWVGASFTPADDRTDAQKSALELSDHLIGELQQADTLVIGLPVYNFGVPASFKAWVDQIARPGVTFQYTSNGVAGLLRGKRAIVVYASGGVPMGSAVDFASGHVHQVMNFIGIEDVQFIAAEGMERDADAAVNAANAAVDALAV